MGMIAAAARRMVTGRSGRGAIGRMHSAALRMIARLEVGWSIEATTVEGTTMETAATKIHARHPAAETTAGFGDLWNDERCR